MFENCNICFRKYVSGIIVYVKVFNLSFFQVFAMLFIIHCNYFGTFNFTKNNRTPFNKQGYRSDRCYIVGAPTTMTSPFFILGHRLFGEVSTCLKSLWTDLKLRYTMPLKFGEDAPFDEL